MRHSRTEPGTTQAPRPYLLITPILINIKSNNRLIQLCGRLTATDAESFAYLTILASSLSHSLTFSLSLTLSLTHSFALSRSLCLIHTLSLGRPIETESSVIEKIMKNKAPQRYVFAQVQRSDRTAGTRPFRPGRPHQKRYSSPWPTEAPSSAAQQRPTSFGLHFSPIRLADRWVAGLGPTAAPKKASLLNNCHFNSMPSAWQSVRALPSVQLPSSVCRCRHIRTTGRRCLCP